MRLFHSFAQCECGHVHFRGSHLAVKLPNLQNVLAGSLGHVLGHSLPDFILQEPHFLPFCLQRQPFVIGHLREDKKTDLFASI